MQILNRQNQQHMRTLHEVTSQFNAGATQPISQCTEQCALHSIVTIQHNIALVIATYIGPSMIATTSANQLFWSRRLTWGYRSNLSTGCCVSQWWLCNNVDCILLERTASKTGARKGSFIYSIIFANWSYLGKICHSYDTWFCIPDHLYSFSTLTIFSGLFQQNNPTPHLYTGDTKLVPGPLWLLLGIWLDTLSTSGTCWRHH